MHAVIFDLASGASGAGLACIVRAGLVAGIISEFTLCDEQKSITSRSTVNQSLLSSR